MLIEQIIQLRQQYRLKLPDAIIAAMALQATANLVTADREYLSSYWLVAIALLSSSPPQLIFNTS